MLDKKELERYSRQIKLNTVGEAGQLRLKSAKVTCIGAGALGNTVLQSLVAAGVGHITVIDEDQIERSNLARQPLFSEEDIGRDKVEVLVEKLSKQNPHVNMVPIKDALTVSNAKAYLKEADCVIDCTDRFNVKYIINAICQEEGLPLVMASILRSKGYCTLIVPGQENPCYRCLFPSASLSAGSCTQEGVLSPVPALLASMQACLVVQ